MPTGRSRRTERVVGYGLPVRFHRRRQSLQDRIDDRRALAPVADEHRGAFDPRAAVGRGNRQDVCTVGRAAAGIADGQRIGIHFQCATTVLREPSWHLVYPAGNSLEQRVHRILQQPPSEGVPEPHPLDEPARSARGDRGFQRRPQSSAPPLVAGLAHAGRVRAALCTHTHQPVDGREID